MGSTIFTAYGAQGKMGGGGVEPEGPKHCFDI